MVTGEATVNQTEVGAPLEPVQAFAVEWLASFP
jgi:hypothetical protein